MVILIYVLLGIGVLFNGLGSFALLRFPDVFTRLHGATKCTTFGSIFTILATVAYGFWGMARGIQGDLTLAVHALLALIALLLTNPTGAHAIARGARRSGVLPKRAVVDAYEGYRYEEEKES
ncbi:MAG: monovalent cation/H(+) antiporter subunit G [Candidatus Bipolaricaulia bacterium]